MKKVLAVIAAAILFGAVAGGTMLGITHLAGLSSQTQSAVSSINETVPELKSDTEAPETEAAAEAGTKAEETDAETKAEAGKKQADDASAASDKSSSTSAASDKSASVKSASDKASAAKESGSKKASAKAASAKAAVLDVSDIVEEAMPELVSITNTMVIKQMGYGNMFDYFYGNGSASIHEYEVPASGSGVILEKTDDELLIVTNNHVIEDSKELSVTFIDGKTVNAAIKGADSSIDIAVIAIPLSEIPDETMEKIKIATLHEDEDLKVGQGVIAIGNALGYGQTVTVGYISALDREISAENSVYSNLIQVDAAINPGNSGGALLNMDGEVIGINVAKLSQTSIEGVGFSIPIYKASEVISNLSNAKTRVEVDAEEQGRMGIYMNTVSEANAAALSIPAGVIIKGFSDEEIEGYKDQELQYSPAKEAGLLKNDIITKFDGQSIKSAEELSSLMKYYERGREVDVTVQRLEEGAYNEKVITVKLGGKTDAGTKVGEDTGKKKDGKTDDKKQEDNAAGGSTDGSEGSNSNGENGYNFNGNSLFDIFEQFLEQYR